MYAHASQQLSHRHGEPLTGDGAEVAFTVIGMGKFGGRELNFSSDLDVMMVYSAEGKTTKGMSNADYFSRLGLELVNRMKGNEGQAIYELDLRLRPFGTGGAIALSDNSPATARIRMPDAQIPTTGRPAQNNPAT